MKEVDWFHYPDARERDGLASVGGRVPGDGEDEMQDAAGAPDDKGGNSLNEPVVKKVETDPIDVHEVVDVHAVTPDDRGEPFDYHTHGLEQFGHPEFQVLAPGYCRGAMANLLWNHAEAVITAGERFAAGETVTVNGVVCGYETVPGDSDDDGPRLRIIDVPGACQCSVCAAAQSNDRGGDRVHSREETKR
jgi:hypothetical protein